MSIRFALFKTLICGNYLRDKEEFGHSGFSTIVAYKSLFLEQVLEAGFAALVRCDWARISFHCTADVYHISDVDIVLLRDPFDALNDVGALDSSVDIAIQTDNCHPSGHFEDLNSGFYYARPTRSGKDFAKRVNAMMLTGKTNVCLICLFVMDVSLYVVQYLRQQIALNKAVREIETKRFAALDARCRSESCRSAPHSCIDGTSIVVFMCVISSCSPSVCQSTRFNSSAYIAERVDFAVGNLPVRSSILSLAATQTAAGDACVDTQQLDTWSQRQATKVC